MIKKFQEVHGGRYDYSLMEYINTQTKVKIKCNKHSIVFEQTPNIHLANKTHVCAECIREQIIEQFKKVHGNRYDYSLVEYNNNKIKIKIICQEHGVFEQTPHNHKNGRGCCKCSVLSQEQVIEQFQEVHGDKYDYSVVEYKNNQTKVKIICKEHGTFEQKPNNHKKGQGCPNCTVISKEEIMALFKEVHGDKYDYSKVNYSTTMNKVEIICPEHGVFEQTPDNHKNGHGCSHCANTLTAKEIYQNKSAILYYILINDSQYKVGITKTSVNQRYHKEIKEGIDIKVIREIEFQDGYQAFLLEQKILKKSQDRGTLLKEDCIIDSGYSEVRTSNFIDIFDNIVDNFTNI